MDSLSLSEFQGLDSEMNSYISEIKLADGPWKEVSLSFNRKNVSALREKCTFICISGAGQNQDFRIDSPEVWDALHAIDKEEALNRSIDLSILSKL